MPFSQSSSCDIMMPGSQSLDLRRMPFSQSFDLRRMPCSQSSSRELWRMPCSQSFDLWRMPCRQFSSRLWRMPGRQSHNVHDLRRVVAGHFQINRDASGCGHLSVSSPQHGVKREKYYLRWCLRVHFVPVGTLRVVVIHLRCHHDMMAWCEKMTGDGVCRSISCRSGRFGTSSFTRIAFTT